MISITKIPKFIESSKSKITVELTYTSDAIGIGVDTGEGSDITVVQPVQITPKKAYVQLHVIPSKNVSIDATDSVFVVHDLLEKPFINNISTFNIGNALHSLFTSFITPDRKLRVQKNESSCFGYFLKYGYITYNSQNEQVKNYAGKTTIKWVYNSAFENDQNITEWIPDYEEQVPGKFLTNIPNNHRVHINEDVLLSVFIPKNIDDSDDEKAIFLKGDFYFNDNTSLLDKTIQSFTHRSGGNYIINFKPSLSFPITNKPINNLTKYTVWLEYLTGSDSAGGVGDVPNYTSTANYTATCQPGTFGYSVTRTATSTSEVSQTDADQKAYTKARQDTEAELSCQIIYTSTRSYTATCPTGYVGSFTATTTATSLTSQVEADTIALADATEFAQDSLQCSIAPTTYTASATYTATCPSGTTGNAVTVSLTRTSTISQVDAQAQANADAMSDATGDLVCIPDEPTEYWYCYYREDGCFSGQMESNLGNYRPCDTTEGRGCWVEYGGQEYCGINPY